MPHEDGWSRQLQGPVEMQPGALRVPAERPRSRRVVGAEEEVSPGEEVPLVELQNPVHHRQDAGEIRQHLRPVEAPVDGSGPSVGRPEKGGDVFSSEERKVGAKRGQIRVQGGREGLVLKREEAEAVVAAPEVQAAGAPPIHLDQMRIAVVPRDLILDEGKGIGTEALGGLDQQVRVVGGGLEEDLQELEVRGQGLFRDGEVPLAVECGHAVAKDLRRGGHGDLFQDRAAA